MTKLEAVNEMLEWVGQDPVTAITVSGNDETNQCETTLDRENRRIQTEGWYVNTLQDVELSPPEVQIAGAAGTGIFTFNETVTQATSGAIGLFRYIESGFIYLQYVSGTFVNTKTLTGASSTATWIGTTYTAQTTGKLAISTDVLAITPSAKAGEWAKIAQRGTFIYDLENVTFIFSDSVHTKVVGLLAFTDLPQSLASYVAKAAASKYRLWKMKGSPPDQERVAELIKAKVKAEQDDQDLRKSNIFNEAGAQAVLGNRNTRTTDVIIP